MTTINGCSTPAPRFSAANQLIGRTGSYDEKEAFPPMERVSEYCIALNVGILTAKHAGFTYFLSTQSKSLSHLLFMLFYSKVLAS